MANYKNSPTSFLNDGGSTKVNRNWHDRYQENSTSLPVGRVVPLLCEFLQGNSKVKLDIASAVQTNPTSSPVFGRMSVDLQTIYCPLRLYVVGLYGNNLLENDFVETISFPLSKMSTFFSGNPRYPFNGLGCLSAHLRYPRAALCPVLDPSDEGTSIYLHFPVNPDARPTTEGTLGEVRGSNLMTPFYIGTRPVSDYNFVPVLAYLDACIHYYADPFDRVIPFEETSVSFGLDSDTLNLTFNRDIVLIPYEAIMNCIYGAKGFSLPDGLESPSIYNPASVAMVDDTGATFFYRAMPTVSVNSASSIDVVEDAFDIVSQHTFNDGLFPTTFKPDRMTAWYDDEQVLKLTSKTTFDGGNYTALRLAQAEYNRLANNLIKGQTYDDFLDVTYGSDFKTNDAPIRIAVDSYDIRFQDIVNTAARTGQGEVPLGTPVARGYAADNTKDTIEFETLEPGYLFVLGSLVPSVKYSEDVPSHLSYKNLGDTPNRFYDGAAFQNLLFGDMHWTGTNLDDLSMGSQPFYSENMISYDRVSGLLASRGFKSYNFLRSADFAGVQYDSSGNLILEDFSVDVLRSKYVNGSLFDYAFPANSPVTLGEQYEAIASATAQNYYFVFRFDLRVLEPLTNQVLARATF